MTDEMIKQVAQTTERVEDHGRRLASLEACNTEILSVMGEVRRDMAVIMTNMTHLHAPHNCPLLARIKSTEDGVRRCGERAEKMEDGLAEVRDKLREYEAQGRLLRWMFTGGAAVAIGTAAALWKAFGGG
jgi:hypothetical protein